MGHIEVERRAILDDPKERERICETMLRLGDVIMTKRVMIVYERTGNSQTTLRIDNGVQKIITKVGGMTDAARPEGTELPKTPLEQTLRNLAERGFVRAIVGRRNMRAVETDGVELSLRDVIKFDDPHAHVSTLFEVEALHVEPGREATALDLVEYRMKELRLTPLTDAEFETWARETHAAADQPFTYSSENAEVLATTIHTFATS